MPQDPVISSANLIPGITIPTPVLQTPTFTPKLVVLSGTTTVTTGQSGTAFLLALASGFTATLPALAFGLFYRFIVKTTPTSGDYVIASSETNKIVGAVYSASGAAEDSQTTLGSPDVKFKSGVAVVGDSIDLWCDGVQWFSRAYCAVTAGILYTNP